MKFEIPDQEPVVKNPETIPQKQGVYLKGFIALTIGAMRAKNSTDKDSSFLKTAAREAQEAYTALDELEKKIDPTGNLSAEVAEMTKNGLGRLSRWARERVGTQKRDD